MVVLYILFLLDDVIKSFFDVSENRILLCVWFELQFYSSYPYSSSSYLSIREIDREVILMLPKKVMFLKKYVLDIVLGLELK